MLAINEKISIATCDYTAAYYIASYIFTVTHV